MDDPSVNYVFNTDITDMSQEKKDLFAIFFSTTMKIHRHLGGVVIRNAYPQHAIGRCVQMWFQPDVNIFCSILSSGFFNYLKLGFFNVIRGLELGIKAKSVEDRFLTPEILSQTYKLTIASTHSDFQKQGLMKNCMVPVLNAIDELNAYAWLECTKEDNLGLYEHYGFKVVETFELSWFSYFSGKPNVKLWSMLRNPSKKDI